MFSAIAAVFALFASPASASDLTITGYSLPDAQAFGAGTFNGYSYYVGPIILHVQNGSDIYAYCTDLEHFLKAGSDYDYGALSFNGQGAAISQQVSNQIGRIAIAGFAAMGLPTPDGNRAAAAQLAIWALAYDKAPTSFANLDIKADYDELMATIWPDNGTRATAMIAVGNWPQDGLLSQQMVIGVEAAVPEAATWIMMIVGFAGVGFVAYRRRQGPALAA